MEQVRNEQTIYSAAVYCRLSKDDEQADEYLNIETLTANMLNQLIERIEIGHTVKVDGCRQQQITIVYRFIGTADEI